MEGNYLVAYDPASRLRSQSCKNGVVATVVPSAISTIIAKSVGPVAHARGSDNSLRPQPFGQIQLIDLVGRDFRRRTRVPGLGRRLAGRIDRFHRLPDDVHLVGEQIADEQIGDLALELRKMADEVAEAETTVLFHE